MNGDYQHAYFPAFLDLDGRLAVVIGGASAAEEHTRTLLRYGADVLVIAPEVTPGLDELVAHGSIEHEQRAYVRGDLGGAFLTVCALSSIEIARAVYQEAEGSGCLITCVNAPELSNFMMPAVVERGLMQVAVSTAGASPEVASRVKARLEDEFGPEWEEYVMLLGQLRRLVLDAITDPGERRDVFEAVADSDVLDRIARGEIPTPEEVMRWAIYGDPVREA